LNAIGEEQLVMWNSLLAIFVLPLAFYVGSHWGTAGIAAVWVVVYPVVQIQLLARVLRRVRMSRMDYVESLWPALSGCAVMALAIWGWNAASGGQGPLYLRLTLEILIGAFTYGLMLFLFHREHLKEMAEFVRPSGG